jgi:nickel transport protein
MLSTSLRLPRLGARLLLSIILGSGALALASPAQAHRVLVFAYAAGDTIHTESKFVPDTPVRQGNVSVLDKQTDKVLLTGQTNDQGKFTFTIPEEAKARRLDLLIVVEAAMGHRGQWLLKADNYLPHTDKTAAPAPMAPTPTVAGTPGARFTAMDRQALEEALSKVMEQQLAPIREMLTDLTVRRRNLPEIIGGLGYIVGIFGVVAYFMSKKQPKP